jgi:DNA helicase-2/ATP-dependent DNA helicase PcrA
MAECTNPIDALNGFRPPAATAEHWEEFEATIGMLRRNVAGWPAELDLVCRWYRPHLERIHEDAVLREADLVQLTQIASTYPSRERFLTELTLDPPDATSDEAGVPLLDEDYLILSTIHSAKGQEWTSVFLLNTVDGCLPSDLATGSTPEIEEERRLLYVAMTRAKDQLHLMVPQRFFTHGQRSTGDRHVYAQRTRFIPNSVLDQFESHSWPPPKSVSEGDGRTREPVDVRAKMRRMWR